MPGDSQRPDFSVIFHRTKKLALLLGLIVDRMVGFVLAKQSHCFSLEDQHLSIRGSNEELLLDCSDDVGRMLNIVDHLSLRLAEFPPVDAPTHTT